MLLHMKNTLLFIALSLIIYLIDINYCDAQTQSSSLRGNIYDYDATGIRNRYKYMVSNVILVQHGSSKIINYSV